MIVRSYCMFILQPGVGRCLVGWKGDVDGCGALYRVRWLTHARLFVVKAKGNGNICVIDAQMAMQQSCVLHTSCHASVHPHIHAGISFVCSAQPLGLRCSSSDVHHTLVLLQNVAGLRAVFLEALSTNRTLRARERVLQKVRNCACQCVTVCRHIDLSLGCVPRTLP